MQRFFILCSFIAVFLTFSPQPLLHTKELKIELLYLEYKLKRPATLSNLVAPPEDDGLQGARLGIVDNNTTGKFLKHDYVLEEVILNEGDDFQSKLGGILKEKSQRFIIVWTKGVH